MTGIVLGIKLNAAYGSDIILGYKMTFFPDIVENMSKIAVFACFMAVTSQNLQIFKNKLSLSNS